MSFFAASAHAGPSEEGFHGFLGAGVAYRADYDGAKERRALALPVSMLSYRKGAFDISTNEGLRYWAVNNPDWQVALVLGADFGRSERKTRFGLGSERLVGMGKLKTTPEIGVSATWTGAGMPLSLDLLRAADNKGHGGTHGSLSTNLPLYAKHKLQLTANAALSFGDGRYQQAYYGVTPEQAARTAFKAYSPGAGFHGMDLSVSARYALNEHWGAMGSVGYHRLLGDAAKSPLTERKGTPTLFLGVGYAY
nr:MipA/OmpV family protein [uncultured Roseateles sp.]